VSFSVTLIHQFTICHSHCSVICRW